MDILHEKKRQDVKEHPDQEWNLPGAKKKKASLKTRQILFGPWARIEKSMSLSSEVFSKMDPC